MLPQLEGYEWDEAKRLENLNKREIDFATVQSFDWDSAQTEESPRSSEMRYYAKGFIGDRLYAVVYTWRGNNRRIISLRAANSRERSKYDQVRLNPPPQA